MATESVRAHVLIPKELIEAVDQLVGQRKRSAFFVEAVEEKLERERLGQSLVATAGVLADDERPEWSTPERVSEWVRELRAVDRASGDRKLIQYDER
jgi:predicted transcriptional regulator